MTEEEAMGWMGGQVIFSGEAVHFRRHTCERPSYEAGVYTESDFLNGFRISKSELGITEDSVVTFNVRCDGAHWAAPGAFLIVVDDGLLTIWDGVFLELTRDATTGK